ncbi:MAG TPA: cyanophycinase [Blastocatellia bacterium]|nr:cyanophycinase [Blastocatellia bacterium]
MAESRNGRRAAAGKGRKAGQQKDGKRPAAGSARPARGTLIIIGGSEDKRETKVILREAVRRIGSGRLVISTLASDYGEEVWELYRRIFTELGVRQIGHLGIEYRDESEGDPRLDILAGATAMFFTGGDQLRITTRLGGTPLSDRIEEIFRRGGVIAGTSAGASALGEMMLVGSPGGGLFKVGDMVQMVPGLGLLRNVIIDQHFSERGRIRRLLGAVAQNPRMLGIGIDEDTAIIVENEADFQVLGAGAVYVVDGHDLSYTNISEDALGSTMSVFGVKLHVLSQGDGFNLKTRQPASLSADAAEQKVRAEKVS